MKTKILVLAAAILAMVFITACGKTPEVHISVEYPLGSVPITITTPEEFQSNLSRWAGHLEEMAIDTTNHFDRWEKGEISQEEFTAEAVRINETMIMLKRESDLRTEYDLNPTPDEQQYYDQVLDYYDSAKKSLNDFLVLAVSSDLTADQTAQLMSLYASRVLVEFDDNLGMLKDSLARR